MRRYPAFTAATVVMLMVASSLSGEVLYHVTDLGTLGRNPSSAYSINNKGQIVGEAYTTGGLRIVRRQMDGLHAPRLRLTYTLRAGFRIINYRLEQTLGLW